MFVGNIVVLFTFLVCIMSDLDESGTSRHRYDCCPGVGCFSRERTSKFFHLFEAPKCLDTQKVALYLKFANRTLSLPQTYTRCIEQFQQMTTSRKLYVIIHGFGASFPHNDYNALRTLLNTQGHNVILVDWSDGARAVNKPLLFYGYVQAISNGRLVGVVVSKVLDSLIAQKGQLASNIHIVGYSLGAHVAGFVGEATADIGSITGLDPSSLMFTLYDPVVRLDNTDASFVQVIHTTGSIFRGTKARMGHVDFYANDGENQPGCGRMDCATCGTARRRVALLLVMEQEWLRYNAVTASAWLALAMRNQIKVTLEASSTSTLGTVELAFDIGDSSPTRDYWKFNTDVMANSIISTVKSAPWEFSLLQNIYLRHGYEDWFKYDSFELQKLIVEDSNGNRYSKTFPSWPY